MFSYRHDSIVLNLNDLLTASATVRVSFAVLMVLALMLTREVAHKHIPHDLPLVSSCESSLFLEYAGLE